MVGLAETAATFGMTERELIDDLNLAWCVELRAPEPYCPIDLSYEDGEISISQAESIARPLRLAADEASALLVALRMLAEAGGDGDAVARLIAKIEDAAGAAGAASAQVAVQIEHPNARGMAATLNAALAAGKRVHLRHYVPGRDEATERDVDPMRLLVVEGRTYLEGWCRRAEGVRLFRLDRVLSVDVLDVPAEVPETAEPVDVDAGLFTASPSDVLVELELAPGRALGGRVLPVRVGDRAGRRAAAHRAAHPGHDLGAPPGAAPRRGRPGAVARRAGGRGPRRRGGGPGPVRVSPGRPARPAGRAEVTCGR